MLSRQITPQIAALRVLDAQAALDLAVASRDALVVEMSGDGYSRRALAEQFGVSAGRIQQIIAAAHADSGDAPAARIARGLEPIRPAAAKSRRIGAALDDATVGQLRAGGWSDAKIDAAAQRKATREASR